MLIEWGTRVDVDKENITSDIELDNYEMMAVLCIMNDIGTLDSIRFILDNFSHMEIEQVVEKHKDEIYEYCISHYENASELWQTVKKIY